MTTHIVSFSGGRTSAFLVHLLEEKRKAAGIKTRYIYLDTSAEHPATYQFIRDIVKYWGIELTCLRVVINPELGQANTYREVSLDEIGPDLQVWKDICGKYGTPYLHGPFCTRVMKKEVYDRYLKDQYPDGDFVTYLGIRADEPRRLKPRKGVVYLADIDDSEKPDILRWWKQQPFDLQIREHLGNCVFCVKKRPNKIALAARDEPELAQQFIDVITSPDVRPVPHRKQQDNKIMYRDNQSLEQIIAISSQFTREELFERIRWSGGEDAGSCSESCEVFNDSSDDDVEVELATVHKPDGAKELRYFERTDKK